MQTRLTVGVLVLPAERLVCAIRYLSFLFQTIPAGIFAEPQEVAVFIGHLFRYADLVAVEVVGLLAAFAFFIGPVEYLCQGFVAVGIGVDIGISAVPNESSFLFEAVFVVDEAGKGKRIGQGRLKVISDNLDILLGLDPTYAC